MAAPAAFLLAKALATAMLLAVPAIALVAAIGVLVGMLQTIFQVQDSNVAFLPKFLAVGVLAVIAGGPALAMLRELIVTVAIALPRLAAG